MSMRVSRRAILPAAVITASAAMALWQAQRSPAWAQSPAMFYLQAPELVGGPWLNTAKGAPLKLADQRGKVVILHVWTFG
jgi:hypothetical protein